MSTSAFRANAGNTILGSNAQVALNNYMVESLKTAEQSDIFQKLLIPVDIQRDDQTGLWKKTISISRPQGPGGIAKISEDKFKNLFQGGLMGMMIPSREKIVIGTETWYASIGRSYNDYMQDMSNFYDVVKSEAFGDQIAKAKNEKVKESIYAASTKKASTDSANKLTWNDIATLVAKTDTFEIGMIDNWERSADTFVNAIQSIGASETDASTSANIVDNTVWASAQSSFEQAGLRYERATAPRFNLSGIEKNNNSVINIDLASVQITAPEVRTLFSQDHSGQGGDIFVLVGQEGFSQLMEDPTLLNLIGHGTNNAFEAGGSTLSSAYGRFENKFQAISIQGITIINMQTQALYGEGTGTRLYNGGTKATKGAALIARPGYNFITKSSAYGNNGIRVTHKTFDMIDTIDRTGQHEFAYFTFTFGIEIFSPTAFTSIIYDLAA